MVATPKPRATGPTLPFEVLLSERVKAGAALLATGIAIVLTAVLAIWAMPWLPIGMSWDDYTSAVRVSVVLAIGGALMGLVGAYLGGVTGREGGLIETLQSILERRVRVRNRQQFRNRLVRECRRARRDRRCSLSLVLVRVLQNDDVDGPGATSVLEDVAQVVAATVRSSDVPGIAGDGEIGVIAIDANSAAREAIVARLRRALVSYSAELAMSSGSGQKGAVSLSAITPEHAGLDPDLLLAEARASLLPVAAGRTKAAAA
jgi:GGDEF domain-containing protein